MKINKLLIVITALFFTLTSCSKKESTNPENTIDKETFNVTWKVNDKIILEEEIQEGKTPSYKGSTPTKENEGEYHFTFTGWEPTPKPVKSDIVFDAVFEKTINQYTITYEPNGGTPVNPIRKEYGAQILRSEPTSKSGSRFSCWTLDKENTTPVTYPYTITKDVIFYACYDTIIKTSKEEQLDYLLTNCYTSGLNYLPRAIKEYDSPIDHSELEYDYTVEHNIEDLNMYGDNPECAQVSEFVNKTEDYTQDIKIVNNTKSNFLNQYSNYINNSPIDENVFSTKIVLYNISINIDEQYINYKLNFKDLNGVEKNINLILNRETKDITTIIKVDNNYTFKYTKNEKVAIYSVHSLDYGDVYLEFYLNNEELTSGVLYKFKNDKSITVKFEIDNEESCVYFTGNTTGKISFELDHLADASPYLHIVDDDIDKIYLGLWLNESFQNIRQDAVDQSKWYINQTELILSEPIANYGIEFTNKYYTFSTTNILGQTKYDSRVHKIPEFYLNANAFNEAKDQFMTNNPTLSFDFSFMTEQDPTRLINKSIDNFEKNKNAFNLIKDKYTQQEIINFITQ